MKTKINSFKNSCIHAMVFSILIFNTVSSEAQTTVTTQSVYTISGDANGGQMIPAVSANGTATFSGTYDPATHVISYTSNWNNLSAAPSKAGFYIGATGMSGKAFGDPWSFGTNVSGTGTTSGKVTLNDDQANQLLAGNVYYSFATTTNADGEIRGQVNVKK